MIIIIKWEYELLCIQGVLLFYDIESKTEKQTHTRTLNNRL